MNRIIATVCGLFILLMCANFSYAAENTVFYTVDIFEPDHHLARVTATFPRISADRMQVIMPAWRTGRYVIMNLANGIRQMKAVDGAGSQLAVEKIDKNTWQISLDQPTEVTVSYELYANQLSNRSRHIDDSHAYLNACGTFVYCPDFREVPIRVDLTVPDGWRSVSGLESGEREHSFIADNYDILTDSPIETGIHEDYSFSVDDRQFELVIWGQGNHEGQKIVEDYKKMVSQGQAIFGPYPFERYVFMVHATSGIRGATEHINSTIIQWLRFNFAPPENYLNFLHISAHEFIHTWNVKAYRPAGIHTYDYTKENYSRLLWVVEGSTSYFDPLLLIQAELMTPDEYFKELAELIDNYRHRPGRFVMSAAEASFDTWLHELDDRANNASVNIYTKGEILSLFLDLEILRLSGLTRSYRDVHRLLYERFPLSKRGYTEQDVRVLLQEVSGHDFSDWWRDFADGTGEIEIDSLLQRVGLEFEHKITEDDSLPPEQAWVGWQIENKRGEAQISRVETDSPAWQAGLNPSDIIIAFDGMRIRAKNFSERLDNYLPGETIRVGYFRRDELLETELVPISRPRGELQLRRIDQPTDDQKDFYRAWLGVPWPEKED